MRVILEFDLEAERNLYDDVLALQDFYNGQNAPDKTVMLMNRKLTSSEKRAFYCGPSSSSFVRKEKISGLIKKWEEEAEKEGKLQSVLEDFVRMIRAGRYCGWEVCPGCGTSQGKHIERLFLGHLSDILKERKVDVKIKGLDQ